MFEFGLTCKGHKATGFTVQHTTMFNSLKSATDITMLNMAVSETQACHYWWLGRQ